MNHFKHWLVPHLHNGYHPHLLRSHGLSVLVVALLLVQIVSNYAATGQFQVLGYATNVTVGGLLSESNAARSSNGLSGFKLNSKLNAAAQAKANDMIADDYWSHNAPDGATPWDFINSSGYSYLKAGENLAYGFATSSGVHSGWMASSSHRANVLDADFTEIGFGIANGADYQGGENTVVVAMYGQPPAAAPSPAPATEPEPTSSPASTAPAAAPVAESSEPANESKEAEDKKEEKEEDPVEEKEPTKEEEVLRSQFLLASFDDDTPININGAAVTPADLSKNTTNIEALLSGSAHWSLYATSTIILLTAVVYAMKHAVGIYQFALTGEHYLQGHPMLEASMIYLLVWLLLFGSYGVIQ